VGIEHVGVAADPNGFQTKLYEKSRDLVKSIRTRWTVPLDRKHIIGHYQIPNGNQIAEGSAACAAPLDDCETSPNYGGASRHTDPGYNWQWCQYMELLGGSCTCNDAYDHFNCSTDKTMAVRCHDDKVEIDHCTAGCTVKPIGQDDVCAHAPAPGTGDDGGPTTGGGGTTIPGGGGDNGAVGSGGGTAGGEPEGATPAGGCSMTGQASSAPLVWIVLAGIWTRSRRREG
jgi:MYXO-CTERM domain-containing protein